MITLVATAEEFAAAEVVVRGERYRHLFRARRVEVGAPLRIVDGQGQARWAQVVAVDRQEARLQLGAAAPSHEPNRQVRLLVPLPRPERAAWMVEKVTEMGVSAIHFLHSERAPRNAGDGTLARLRRIAVVAVEQSHRARVPEVSGVHAWEELPVLLAGTAARWLLDPEAPVEAPAGADRESAALVLGPEGGLTDNELEQARALGCLPMGLGPTVLRIETAALVAAARVLLAG
jgi:16S rRNA (uracil1498-N3)-methyltransferase